MRGSQAETTSAGSGRKEELPVSAAELVRPGCTLRSPATPPPSATTQRSRSKKEARRARAELVASDRFVEQEVIGRGGMSVVVRARETSLARDVAIKLIPPDHGPTEADVARLAREARITASLDHPAVIPVYEFGTDRRGVAYFSMKLVRGETLEDTLTWAGPSRLEAEVLLELLDIFDKVCDAVAYAHSRGILHLDLKPANVMIADFGQVYVADWGVALPTALPEGSEPLSDRRGLIVGTPHYMAPEQLHGQNDTLDERTDVFLLGAMLHQILTGHPPRSAIQQGLTERIVSEAATPVELSRIAMKAMAHDATDRYPSVGALMRDVRAFIVASLSFPRWASDTTKGPPGSKVA
jgi:serine/threonine-protein kinase